MHCVESNISPDTVRVNSISNRVPSSSGKDSNSPPLSGTTTSSANLFLGLPSPKMPPPPNKRQKREDYRKAHQETQSAELPKKKFYRQRAHANPFSDHQLT